MSSADFFGFEEAYPVDGTQLTDLPTTVTYCKFEDREKTIVNRYDAPKALVEMEKQLEALFNAVQWRKIKEND